MGDPVGGAQGVADSSSGSGSNSMPATEEGQSRSCLERCCCCFNPRPEGDAAGSAPIGTQLQPADPMSLPPLFDPSTGVWFARDGSGPVPPPAYQPPHVPPSFYAQGPSPYAQQSLQAQQWMQHNAAAYGPLSYAQGSNPMQMQPYGAPHMLQFDPRSMAQMVQAINAAQPPSMPKMLKGVADPGHVFAWATTPLSNGLLADYTTTITQRRHRELCPTMTAALERAVEQVSPALLLGHLHSLKAPSGSVSPVDYSSAHRMVLEALVTAVLPVASLQQADQEAARYLFIALKHYSDVVNSPRFQVAYSSLNSHQIPTSPSPLLNSLADAFMPPDGIGTGRRAYFDYLVQTYDLADVQSTPSVVFAGARRIAREKYPTATDVAIDTEARVLFVEWVNRMGGHGTVNDELFRPLREFTSDVLFAKQPASVWDQQLRLLEHPGNKLYGFVSSLAPIRSSSMPPGRGRDGRRGGLPQPPQITQVVHDGSDDMFPDGLEGSQLDFSPPRTLMAFVPAGGRVRDSKCEPLAAALAAALLDPKSVFYLKPFEVPSIKMDAAWVALYGCPECAAPNSADRHLLDIEPLMAACEVPIPDAFHTKGRGRVHVGGDSCPACMFVAHMMGFVPQWYIHPADKMAPPNSPAKPPGWQHKYVHNVFRCPIAHAFGHRLVRSDRDSGRGDARMHLLSPLPSDK